MTPHPEGAASPHGGDGDGGSEDGGSGDGGSSGDGARAPAPASGRRLAKRPGWVGTRRESWLRGHLAFILVAVSYFASWPVFERLNNPNENVRVWMTRAIVEHHTLAIDPVIAEWGPVDDKAEAGGHTFSGKAPGTSCLGVPVAWLESRLWHARWGTSPSKRATLLALRWFATTLPNLALLYGLGRWARRRADSPAARDGFVVGLGLGSLLYPYSTLFVGHATAALLAFASFTRLAPGRGRQFTAGGAPFASAEPALPAARPRRAVAWGMAGAGALAGAAVTFEYQVLLVALLLAGFAWWRRGWTGLAAFVAGALPFAVALGAYHASLFGHPWDFPYGHLENRSFASQHHAGFFGLATPHAKALAHSLFSVDYGLFVFSPFLVPSGLLLAAVAARRRSFGSGGSGGSGESGGDAPRAPAPDRGGVRAEAIVCLLATAILALFLSGMTNWRGGWCVGPRYIAAAAPFLSAGLVLGRSRLGGPTLAARAAWSLVGGALAVAICLNGLSAAVFPHYPEVFDNPVFDLTLPLVAQGYLPYGIGRALGLPRYGSLVPLALLWIGAWALAVAGGGARRGGRQVIGRLATAALVAMVTLAALSRYGRAPSAAEERAAATVRSLWEPPPQVPSSR